MCEKFDIQLKIVGDRDLYLVATPAEDNAHVLALLGPLQPWDTMLHQLTLFFVLRKYLNDITGVSLIIVYRCVVHTVYARAAGTRIYIRDNRVIKGEEGKDEEKAGEDTEVTATLTATATETTTETTTVTTTVRMTVTVTVTVVVEEVTVASPLSRNDIHVAEDDEGEPGRGML
ncbi:hypothetical protein HZH68_007905 [Vespula germanica]|uniref:Uncharacterized protein n=1 Tax=Vespula germanica TaxID=30212 RepID=A0A834K385_VESGE|nr:hypothetical protein HZH68_007905 [Vespula germanica]